MKTLNYFLFLQLYIMIFSSCQVLYIPTVVNAPVFTDKNELHVAGYLGLNGIDLQTAYSLSDHVAMTLNGNFLGTYIEEALNSKSVDFSAGYYDKSNKNLLIAIYGGVGTGSGSSYDYYSTNNLKTRFIKTYIQPQISIYSGSGELSFTARVLNSYYTSGLSSSSGNKSYAFFEPTITGKAGTGLLKIVLQAGFSIPIFGDFTTSESILINQPFMLSAGLQLSISDLFKKKEIIKRNN